MPIDVSDKSSASFRQAVKIGIQISGSPEERNGLGRACPTVAGRLVGSLRSEPRRGTMETGQVDYTLVIPTFNRPSLLAALLAHLRRSGADFPILILDSSAGEAQRQNASAIADSGLNVSHRLFPETMAPDQKLKQGFHLVTTLYASLCADDDLLFVEGLRACVRVMERDPFVAICDGVYLNFEPARASVALRIEYEAARLLRSNDLCGYPY
jgi:hypothetical protein